LNETALLSNHVLTTWFDSKEVRMLTTLGLGTEDNDVVVREATAHRPARTIPDINNISNHVVKTWFDSKEVTMLTTLGLGTEVNDVVVREATAHRPARTIPDINNIYNNYMAGIDINDQMKYNKRVYYI
jgi:hypothetical protein